MPVAPAARAWPNSRPMRRHSGGAFFPAASAPPCILHWAAVVHGTLLSRRSPAKRIDSEGARAHAFDTADSCFWSSFPQIVTKGMPPKRRSPEQLDAAARGRATQAASKARRVACSSTAENGACFCGAVPPILDPPSLILIADPRRRPRRRHPSHLHPFASAPRQQPASRGHAARDVPGHEVSCLRRAFKIKLLGDTPVYVQRRQIPLVRAYAMTINKSQGMTMGKCLFDARCAPFQHGHAYVLFSRVRNRQSIAAVVDDATQRNGHLVTRTILYDELLRDACEACDETP